MRYRKVKKENNSIICSDCGSSRIVRDDLGFYICETCGAVLTDIMPIEASPSYYHVNGESTTPRQPQSAPHNLITSIGNESERHDIYKKLNLYQKYSVPYKNEESEAMRYFSIINDNFGLNFSQMEFMENFKKVFHGLPKGSHARNIPALSVIVCYFMALFRGKFIKKKELLEFFELSKKKFNKITYMLNEYELMKILKGSSGRTDIDDARNPANDFQNDDKDYVNSVLMDFLIKNFKGNLDYNDIIYLSEKVYRLLKSQGVFSRKRVGLALSFLLVQDHLEKIGMLANSAVIRPHKVARYFNISHSILYSRLKHLSLDYDKDNDMIRIKRIGGSKPEKPQGDKDN